jgi:hypothetical protein
MLKKVTLLSATVLSAFAMHQGEVNINSKDLELSGRFDIGQVNDAVEPDTMFVGARYLNADADHSDNEHADIDSYFEASFLMMREVGSNSDLSLGLGVKANYAKDFTTIPLGLEAAWQLPFRDIFPMYLNASLYYAPNVLSFSDADSFLEYHISYDIKIIDNGRIALGYRNLDTNYETSKGGDFTYNKSWYIGFKLNF